MTWAKLKEKVEDHLVTVVFGLITLLCLVIWQAIPAEAWVQLGALIPKRVLAALIGLLFIVVTTLVAYTFSLRREIKNLQTTSQLKSVSNAPLIAETESYEPNDSAKEILRYLANDNCDPHQGFIMQHLEKIGVKRIAAIDAMNDLTKHGFITCTKSRPSDPFPKCRLKEKGIKYALDKRLNESD